MVVHFDVDDLDHLDDVVPHPYLGAGAEMKSSPARPERIPVVALDMLAEGTVGEKPPDGLGIINF